MRINSSTPWTGCSHPLQILAIATSRLSTLNAAGNTAMARTLGARNYINVSSFARFLGATLQSGDNGWYTLIYKDKFYVERGLRDVDRRLREFKLQRDHRGSIVSKLSRLTPHQLAELLVDPLLAATEMPTSDIHHRPVWASMLLKRTDTILNG